jgi:hypothetical protein
MKLRARTRVEHVLGRRGRLASVVALVVTLTAVWIAGSSAATGTRSAVSTGTTTGVAAGPGADGIKPNEVDPGALQADGSPIVDRARPGFKNGKFPKKPLDAATVASSAVSAAGSELGAHFNGLNHRDQRLANGGNQFSLEPPDQGLCAGNGRVIEAINDVIKIYDTSGTAQTGTVDLNTFYGYPAAVVRGAPNVFGPSITDPSCLYDANINRFIVVALTLDRVGTTSTLSGVNHLDIAVSPNGSPSSLTGWKIYKIDVTDDGTNGTPNHGCTSGVVAPRHPGATVGDYPHIGADANGIYVTTNEYCFFGNGFNGAQIYAIGKQQLAGASLPSSINFVQVENTRVEGSPGFTVWPAQSQAGQYASDQGGTEFFVSTIAGDGSETGNPTGTARRIGIWALTNTSSLNSGSPNVSISSRLINSQTYVFPPKADQKVGNIPQGDCINDTSSLFGPGLGCWALLFNAEPAHNEVESKPDSNDTRIQQVWYAGGRLYTATDTAVNVGGQLKAGIAWFVIDPKVNGASKIEGKIANQGYLALASNNLTYPAWAVLPNGKGVMAFTVLGQDYYPSAGYAVWNGSSFGNIHIAGAGTAPDDGFTSYKAQVGDPPRTRWGDYGAAVVDGNNIWVASEYIGARNCTLDEWLFGGPIGSCGGTRTSIANWGTFISKVTP